MERESSVIRESNDYVLTIGIATTSEVVVGTPVYQVRNKDYDVVELESTSLAYCLRNFNRLQKDLNDSRTEKPAGDHEINKELN